MKLPVGVYGIRVARGTRERDITRDDPRVSSLIVGASRIQDPAGSPSHFSDEAENVGEERDFVARLGDR